MLLDLRNLNLSHHFLGEVMSCQGKSSSKSQQRDGGTKIGVPMSSAVIIPNRMERGEFTFFHIQCSSLCEFVLHIAKPKVILLTQPIINVFK